MKKYFQIVLIAILLLLAGSSFAQRFNGGLIAGFNASQVEGDHLKGYHKPGVLFGGFVQTDISNKAFIGMELKYSQKGSRKKPDPKNQDQLKYIMRLGYMDVPFYIGLRTGDNISILGGISGGYLMQAAEYDNYDKIPEIEQRPFNTIDVQAFLGLRIELNKRISIDLRGAYSILPTRDLPGDRTDFIWDDEFNNVLSTAVYYRLDY